jgi:hypothetical protein
MKKKKEEFSGKKSGFTCETGTLSGSRLAVRKRPQFWGITPRIKCDARRRNLLVRALGRYTDKMR